MPSTPFSLPVTIDAESFVRCLRREGTPWRVHPIELFLDVEVKTALCERYDLQRDLNPDDPYFDLKREIILQRFLGYDYVRVGVEGVEMEVNWVTTGDTADLARASGRHYMNEHKGPITTWEEFEAYPWPDPANGSTRALEWYERNLPDDMCIIGGGGFGHFAEHLTWLMGYETLCYALYDQPDLVQAISDRVTELYRVVLTRILQFDRVKAVWGSDDMGYRSGTLIGPEATRHYALTGHKLMAEMSHAAGRPYLLHSCGNLESIMEDLIEDVRIDAKHSFEDTIEDVREDKRRYGQRLTLLGGIDMDFLCRADEDQVRARVRDTLEICHPGGGYCLGTGNTMANYVPIANYLAMLDEGRRFTA